MKLIRFAALLVSALFCASAAAQPIGDARRGELLYQQRCSACHSMDANRVGPMHRGVYGRPAGAAEGFHYSPALRDLEIIWNDATLDRWLANPPAMAPGTSMGVRTLDSQDRADIIAYLRSAAAH